MDQIKQFIETMLFSKGTFAPRGFAGAATIYRARMRGSFVSTLINGVEEDVSFWAPAGRQRYEELLRRLSQLTGNEQVYWFYISEAADGKASLSWLRKARKGTKHDTINQPLTAFEIEPAPAGGGTHLGLVGENQSWLLLHSYYPDQEFDISIHGPDKLCNDLCRLVRSSSSGPETL